MEELQKKQTHEELTRNVSLQEQKPQEQAPELLQEEIREQNQLQDTHLAELGQMELQETDLQVHVPTKKDLKARKKALKKAEQDAKRLEKKQLKKVKAPRANRPEGPGPNAGDLNVQRAKKLTRKRRHMPNDPPELTPEQLQKNREKAARKADRWDNFKYKVRHAFYNMSKAIVMGFKKLRKPKANMEEHRTTSVPLRELLRGVNPDTSPEWQATLQAKMRELERITGGNEALLNKLIDASTLQVPLITHEEVFLGGTKPMSQYIGADGSKWLAKQAVNCMGYYKIEGALLTEAGARLQIMVDPSTAVDAFVGRTKAHGDVSFQRRLERVEGSGDPGGKLDLFKFSKHPELATAKDIADVQALAPQILREHTTDWLLCNFDTKGENFVITRDENQQRILHGIDKEAAFNKILDPGAQHMSTSYKPHANNTLYNVIFTMYSQNKMDLNLFDVLPQIQKMEQMNEVDYMQLYRDYLDHLDRKYHSSRPKKDAELRRKYLNTTENIKGRWKNLRQDYTIFFTQLVNQRAESLDDPQAAQELKNRYFGPGGQVFNFDLAH